MPVIVVNRGEVDFLDLVLAEDYTLHLYTNDPTDGLSPAEIDALEDSDFDEATFPGYAAQALVGGSWSTVSGNPSPGTYGSALTFARSATGTPEEVTGYYVTADFDGDALVWFEAFDGPVVMEFDNDEIEITPRLTLDDREGNEVETGTIVAFGGTAAPPGWLLCNGSAISRSTFAALFAVLGTAFGAGNGSTTFNLPDLRQRFPLGQAAAGTGSTLGATGGAIDHDHGLATASSHAQITLASNAARVARKTVPSYNDTVTFTATGGATATTANAQTTAAALAGDTDVENPPYQVVNFIVKT